VAARAEVARLAGKGEKQVVGRTRAAECARSRSAGRRFEKGSSTLFTARQRGLKRATPEGGDDALPQRTAAVCGAIDRRAIGLHAATNATDVAADECNRYRMTWRYGGQRDRRRQR